MARYTSESFFHFCHAVLFNHKLDYSKADLCQVVIKQKGHGPLKAVHHLYPQTRQECTEGDNNEYWHGNWNQGSALT